METNNPSRHNHNHDEIDLIELLRLLWEKRWVIVLSTAIFLVLGVATAFYIPPSYKTHTTALPTTYADLEGYNSAQLLVSELESLTPEQAFLIFTRNLASNSLRLDFFENHYLPEQALSDPGPEQRQQMWRSFNQALQVDIKNDRNLSQATVEFKGSSPQLISRWANEYLKMGIEAARKEITANLNAAIQHRIQTLTSKISSLREAAEEERQNQILRLQEALAVANKIEQELPPSNGSPIAPYFGETSYLRGYKALKAEIETLKARQNNDPFIRELPKLLQQKSMLESIHIAPESIAVVFIDGTAIVPEQPYKPNKKLIVTISLLLGIMAGVFFVLIRQAFRTSRQS